MSEVFRYVVWGLFCLTLIVQACIMSDMRRRITRLTKALRHIAGYDLVGADPFAASAMRQWARKALAEEADDDHS